MAETAPLESEAVIELESVRITYRGFVAVDDLSLRVAPGEVFGFVGPNGAGKSSTLKVMLDLLRPERGTVRVLGTDVRSAAGARARARIGYLPGDLSLFGALSVRATLDLFARLQGRAPERRAWVLDALGFAKAAWDRRLRACSTGMRQAVGITAALQHDPELLILDEPTTGLDPVVRDTFLEILRATAQRGRTVFFSSHVLDEVEAAADRIGFLHRGRLRFLGTVDDLQRTRPRTVKLRFEDGRQETRIHSGSPTGLLEELRGLPLADVEIRPAGLREAFRSWMDTA